MTSMIRYRYVSMDRIGVDSAAFFVSQWSS